MEIVRDIIDAKRYNIKCPYTMNPEFIIVHNTGNDASAKNEITYMKNNDNKVSFHWAVDDIEARQGIEENRNTWNAGDGTNGKGNRKGIAVEICYSKSGGDRFIQAEKNAVKLIVSILKKYGWGIGKVTKHQDYNGKYCPHKTLDLGWERFLNMIREELGEATVNTNTQGLVAQWQTIMNSCYNCGLAVDNSFGPDSTAKANKYYLRYKTPVIVNEHVRFVQKRLNAFGYNLSEDGSFGPATANAVKQFQKAKGLIVDGYVGANTTKKLLNL